MSETAYMQIIPVVAKAPKKLRVAAYCRVSSDSLDQINSYNSQLDYYTSLISSNPKWLLSGIYADKGITGTSLDGRDDFNRMIDDARKGRIDKILVKSISRFARNTKDCLKTVRELSSLNISVVFEEDNIDTATMHGEMLISTLSSVSQQGSVSISKNMKWSYKKRMQSGSFITAYAPFGYTLKNNKLIINPKEAPTVRKVFEMYLNGHGIIEISKILNKEKAKRRSHNSRWNDFSIKYMLTNEKYVGDSLMQKYYRTDFPFKQKINKGEYPKYYIKGSHEGIISREEYKKVQELLYKRFNEGMSKHHENHYALSDILRCGKCGGKLKRKTIRGIVYRICRGKYEGNDCTLLPIIEEEIANAFLKIVNTLKEEKHYILYPLMEQTQRLRLVKDKTNPALMSLDKEIIDSTKQLQTIQRLRAKDVLDAAFYIEKSSYLKQKIDKLKMKRSKEEKRDNNLMEDTKKIIDSLESTDGVIYEMSDELLKDIVSRIDVFPDNTLKFTLINKMIIEEKIYRRERRK